MKLAASHIAWQPEEEPAALEILKGNGFSGLEIVPPRVAGPRPYDNLEAAASFAAGLRRGFGFVVCSMQSIWYGQTGSLFGPEREALLGYTQQAIRFAETMSCANLVFGCPKNRVRPEGQTDESAVDFFCRVGEEAARHGTVVALEANPPLYETNFINTTQQALEMAKRVEHPAFKVNLDVGTMIENGEAPALLEGQVAALHHVHISEPGLVMLAPRPLHRELAAVLRSEEYSGFVSIEMKGQSLADVARAAAYVAEVFA